MRPDIKTFVASTFVFLSRSRAAAILQRDGRRELALSRWLSGLTTATIIAGVYPSAGKAQLESLPMWSVSRQWTVSASLESLDQPVPPVVTQSGIMFVADNADGTVSRYDVAGRRVARGGTRGQGPGELQRFSLAGGTLGDSAWFYNGFQRRLVLYAPTNRSVRTIDVPSSARLPGSAHPTRGFTPLGLLPDGRMIMFGSKLDDAGLATSLRQVAIVDRSGMGKRVLATVNDSLASVVFQRPYFISAVMPLGFRPLIRTSANGTFTLVVSGKHGRNKIDTVFVTVIRSSGDTAYNLRQTFATKRVSQKDLERGRERILAFGREQKVERALRDTVAVRMPSTFPVVTDAIITSEGRAWLRLQPSGDDARYLSIAPSGKPDGVVSLPHLATLVSSWGNRVWVTEVDADGFQNMALYTVQW